ncbi:MAG TPA: TonB-dependent receptor [Sphingomicrobium sp.]|nr:TonB-dependent receptor [Sphingomicrobium sp.]
MTITRHMRAALFASAALIAAPSWAQDAAQTTAQAQDEPAADTATAAPDAEGAEEEIVVTARRTEESLQRVPSSVSAFNERSLERIQATDTTGLQGAVPNLNIVQGRGSSNATNIFIRGIGQPDALQTFDPAVGVYVDDVYLSRIRGNQLDLLDLERLEVLRGPQGTLYGKNTIGGAIKFVTRKPGDELRANGSVTFGSYDQFDFKGAVSGPLTDVIGAGIAVMRATRDGFVEDEGDGREYNDRDTVAGRAIVAFTPSDRLRIDLTADYSRDNAKLNVGRPLNNLVQFSGGVLVVDEPVGSGDYDWEARITPGFPNSTKLRSHGFSGTVAFDITDELTFKSISALRRLKTDDYIDIDATQYEVGDVFVGVRQKQASQEFQLLYTGDRLNAVAGVYYLKERVESHQEAYADDLLGTFFGGGTFLRTIDDKLITRSYAGFANASYAIVPTVRLSAGIRYTKEAKDYDRSTSTFSSNPIFTSLAPSVFTPDRTWDDVSPMASIDWQALPNVMIYGRVAKGFKSGGFNGRANSATERTIYDPETVLSWEAGFKSRIAGQLTLNGAAFTSTYKDFQARVSGTDDIGGIPTAVLSVLNAGKLRINGAELEAAWTPFDNLLVDAQVGYLDAEYKEFDDVRFTTCCGGSRAFQTPAFAPKWTVRLGAQYGFDIGSVGSLTLGAQTRHKSRTALAVDNTFVIGSGVGAGTRTEVDGLFQKGYWLHDARIVFETANKRWALGLFGNNLANRAYKTDAQEFSSVGQIRTVYYGAPRTVSLRLTARY